MAALESRSADEIAIDIFFVIFTGRTPWY